MLTQVLPPWLQDGGLDAAHRPAAERGGPRTAAARDSRQGCRVRELQRRRRRLGRHPDRLCASTLPSMGRGSDGRGACRRSGRSDPLDSSFELLIEDRAATVMIVFVMDEADVREALAHPAAGIGSDLLGVTSDTARVHPRTLRDLRPRPGLGRQGRRTDRPRQAIQRMTGQTAATLGLPDRGRIARAGWRTSCSSTLPRQGHKHVRGADGAGRRHREAMLGGRFAVDGGDIVARDLGRCASPPEEVTAPTFVQPEH